MERYQNGRDNAYEFFDMVRRKLYEAAGVANPRSPINPGGFNASGSLDPLGMSSNSALQSALGSVRLQRGVTPSDSVVQQVIDMMGGNPYLGSGSGSSGGNGSTRMSQDNGGNRSGNGGGYPSTGDPLLDRYLAEAEMERQKANLVNDRRERNIDDIYRERERQADAELTGLRDRVMSEVDNWGNVQSALNEEKAAEARSAINANLAARGLDMSSRQAAFDERNARDLALVQQDLSERKSNRRIGYDSQLTQNLANMRAQLAGDRAQFMERPTDQGPDVGQIMQMAMQYGQGNRGQGFAGLAGANVGGGQGFFPPSFGGGSPPVGGVGFLGMPAFAQQAIAGWGQFQPQFFPLRDRTPPEQFVADGGVPTSRGRRGVANRKSPVTTMQPIYKGAPVTMFA